MIVLQKPNKALTICWKFNLVLQNIIDCTKLRAENSHELLTHTQKTISERVAKKIKSVSVCNLRDKLSKNTLSCQILLHKPVFREVKLKCQAEVHEKELQ